MAGNTYYPISIYGICIKKYKDLQVFRVMFHELIQKGQEINEPQIDIYYCIDYACYSREGLGVQKINAIFGIKIDNQNFNHIENIKIILENFQRRLFLIIKPEFYTKIVLYTESTRDDYS